MGGGPGNNITFTDNNKIVMGTGNDLEIYHSGTNSYIDDVGEGSLFLRSGTTYIQNAAGTKTSILTNAGAGQTLYHNNTPVFETTATGIDVTGIAVADEINLDGGGDVHSTIDTGYVGIAGGTNSNVGANALFYGGSHSSLAGVTKFRSGSTTNVTILSSGNVGIGTSSPNNYSGFTSLGINGSTGGVVEFMDDDAVIGEVFSGADYLAMGTTVAGGNLRFRTGSGSEKVRITSDGNVGIGDLTPSAKLEVAGTAKADQYLIDAIAKDISDTAVDIFIYDTRKDSDGGAWRKRTQHTSWYNETLSTWARGSRKEFPAVAVIVAESNQVTIYDGDDPDLPMWMVFNHTDSGTTLLGRGNIDVKSVIMLNGELCIGTSDGGTSYGTLTRSNFIRDDGFVIFYDTYKWNTGIVTRNINSGQTSFYSGAGIVNDFVNDVAMTVLPNAPIDAATGLPVPTIAVATGGGVSVIKDDGTVIDYTGTSQGSDALVDKISFIGTKRILFSHRYASEVVDLVSSDNSAAYYNQLSSFTGRITNSISHDDDIHVSALSSDNNIESIALNEEDAASKSVSGLSLANHYQVTSDPDRVSCFITTDYNTGWMNGDIKLATLSDTDATNVTGSELVTNGTFDTDTSGWTQAYVSVAPTTFSSVSGQLVARRGDQYRFAVQQLTVEVGKTYTVSVDSPTGDNLMVGKDSNSNQYGFIQTGAAGTGSVTFTATQTALYIMPHTYKNQTTDTIFDNISVRLAEEDRSVNNNGLQVFGTVTKTAVTTGAELVGYSGFSSSNYLRQPYNPDLNFGTGSYSIMGWFKTDATSSIGYVASLGTSDNDESLTVYITRSNYGIYFDYGLSNQYSRLAQTSDRELVTDTRWHHFVCHVSAGGAPKIYVDGINKEVTVNANAASPFTFDTDYVLNVGNGRGLDNNGPFGGSIALLRISTTVPSAAQIKKIYEDEKFLFQENAKATLYGSSDAVTALAYDDDTELLHVGTSAGRSVFQGLRRVDNTTDAVGAAISASNGMVAED